MSDAFSQMLPFALVIAFSPITLVAVIAMLFSVRAIPNGVAFLAGWAFGVGVALVVLTALAGVADPTAGGDDPSDVVTVLRFLLGASLLAYAAKTWRGRPRSGDAVEMPRWMSRIERIVPSRAFGLAVALGAVNPKNLLMHVAAAATLVSEGLSRTAEGTAVVLYSLVASSSVACLVAYRALAGERGAATLERVRGWLVANDAIVMSVLFLAFGVKLVVDAIAGL